jgi:hypothetical protein
MQCMTIAREILISKRWPQVCVSANNSIRQARDIRAVDEGQDKNTVLRCNASRGRRNVTHAAIALNPQRVSSGGYIVAA